MYGIGAELDELPVSDRQDDGVIGAGRRRLDQPHTVGPPGLVRIDPGVDDVIEELASLGAEVDVVVNYLPVEIRISDLAGIAATALGLSMLSTVYPAWRAVRLKPMTMPSAVPKPTASNRPATVRHSVSHP